RSVDKADYRHAEKQTADDQADRGRPEAFGRLEMRPAKGARPSPRRGLLLGKHRELQTVCPLRPALASLSKRPMSDAERPTPNAKSELDIGRWTFGVFCSPSRSHA